MSISTTLTTKVAVTTITSYLKAMIDPNMRRRLDEAITAHVLAELPRIVALLEERCGDLEARGCTHEEANIIAHQVIEAQKRTLDEDKRHRLTNVLVNGLCAERWDKVTHRLMVRFASELEEEHVARLRREVHPLTWEERLASERARLDAEGTRSFDEEKREQERDAALYAVEHALERELISVGLLTELRKKRAFAKPVARGERSGTEIYADGDMETHVRITQLGMTFLDYLRDPAGITP